MRSEGVIGHVGRSQYALRCFPGVEVTPTRGEETSGSLYAQKLCLSSSHPPAICTFKLSADVNWGGCGHGSRMCNAACRLTRGLEARARIGGGGESGVSVGVRASLSSSTWKQWKLGKTPAHLPSGCLAEPILTIMAGLAIRGYRVRADRAGCKWCCSCWVFAAEEKDAAKEDVKVEPAPA